MEADNLRLCKKCLLRDMADQEESFRSLQDYIENLDIDKKAPDALYEERLECCRSCDMLLEAMCRKCGCYVEFRASILKNNCPAKKW